MKKEKKNYWSLLYFIIPFLGIILLRYISEKPNQEIKIIEENTTIKTSQDILTYDLVDFNYDVKPILSDKCYACHGPDDKARQSNLRLDIKSGIESAMKLNNGQYIIDEKHVEKSGIIKRTKSEELNFVMPPPESNLTLSQREKTILTKWIEQGAKWEPHWSYTKPKSQNIPNVKFKDWTENEIDFFVAKKFEEKGLKPSKRENKEILLRRVSFDITGLPPSINQIDNFLNDKSTNAYEKVVDRLLKSASYGERMASIWMDLARYGDSHGYQDDQERIMWPWRDWVIHAYNNNLPYDEFITWQIAGDMIPNATKEQILASGFNRNHKITQEGGVIPEEYRVEYVADRTVTTSKIMMGLTVECARCHTHKYDPITHDEFFSLYSFFNNAEETGIIAYGDIAPEPNLIINKKDT